MLCILYTYYDSVCNVLYLTKRSSRPSLSLTAQASSVWCAILSTPSTPPPPPPRSFSFSFLSSPLLLNVELRSNPFRLVFDFCPFFPLPPSISAEVRRRPSRSGGTVVVPMSPIRLWWMVLCLFLGLREAMVAGTAARGCRGELVESSENIEPDTNIDRTLLAASRVERALLFLFTLCLGLKKVT